MDGIKAFVKLVFDVDMTDQDVRDIVAMAARYARGENVVSVLRINALFSKSLKNKRPIILSNVIEGEQNIEAIKLKAIEIAKAKFSGNPFLNKSDNTVIIVGNQGKKHAMSGKVLKVNATSLIKLDELLINVDYVVSDQIRQL